MIDKIPKLPEIEPKGLKNIFPQQVSPLFIDLLENMLVFNPLHRITAGEALCHSYFD
jgi:serine/threonine protein kinase